MKEYEYEINGKTYQVVIKEVSGDHAKVEVNGAPYDVRIKGAGASSLKPAEPKPAQESAPPPSPQQPSVSPPAGEGVLTAPMPGVVIKLLVEVGDRVNTGEAVIIMEAMKMENEIKAAVSGTVKEIFVYGGDSVNTGDKLLRISSD
ncbi:MAG: biotin/lipoyl-containing protein [bacterium]